MEGEYDSYEDYGYEEGYAEGDYDGEAYVEDCAENDGGYDTEPQQ